MNKEKIVTSNNKIRQKKTAQGALSLTLLNYLLAIMDFFIVIYTSSILSLEEVGLYNLLLQYVPIMTVIITFGMTNTATKFVTRYDSQNQKAKSSAIVFLITGINSLIAIIAGMVFIIFSSEFSLFLTASVDHGLYVKMLGVLLIFIPNLIFNQFFIVRYKFNYYLIGNLVGNLIRFVLFIYFLSKSHDISAFFYSSIISQGLMYIFFVICLLKIYERPKFPISVKEVFQYSLPLFLGRIFLYLKQYAYILILNFNLQLELGVTMALIQIGMLSYIKKIFNLINVAFNSLNNVLTVHYASFLYDEEPAEFYYKTTLEISRFYQIMSIAIGFSFMLISPFFVKFIATIFEQPNLYNTGGVTMILFSFYFIANMFYYIAPTVINIHKESHKLLLIHFQSILVYLLGYFIFIRVFGMIGIPIGQTIGFSFFLYLCKRDISKKYKIGFDWKSLKKIILASIPFAFLVPFLFLYTQTDTSSVLIDLNVFQLYLPLNSIFMNAGGIFLGFSIFILVLRRLSFFKSIDKEFFNEILGKKIGNIVSKILIKGQSPDGITTL